MDMKSKVAFGDKENISTAIENEIIDSYDLLMLSNGEVAWLDADQNPVINTPRLQADIVVDDETAVEAETTLEEAIRLLYQSVNTNSNCNCDCDGDYVVEFDSLVEAGVVTDTDYSDVVEF